MDREKISIQLTVIHAKCSQCGYERILYCLPESSYGERIVSTKDGKLCAYVDLMKENIIPELKVICKDLLDKWNITLSQNNMGRLVSKIYYVTCDKISGQEIDSTPGWKCSNCQNGQMKEDELFGERQMKIIMPYVTHERWNSLDLDRKHQMVENELKKQGFKHNDL